MHSRIIQLTQEKLCSDEYIEEDDFVGFDESISNYILGADYITSTYDRKGDIEWFKNYLCDDLGLKEYVELNLGEKEEFITFKQGFKTAFFQFFFDNFNQLIQTMDLEKFSSYSTVWEMQKIINPDYGFRICSEEKGEMISLHDFVRFLIDDEEITYHIGGVLDYHY